MVAEEGSEKNIDTDSIPKFFITLHPNVFPTRESFNLGYITNWLKHNANSTNHTIEEILQFSSQGRCYMPCFVICEDGGYEFVSSKLILVDVDDDEMVTEPLKVLDQLKDICVGLFYTGSHGIKGNRYRLVFALDESIRNEREYLKINEVLVERLRKLGIPADSNASGATQRVRTAMNGYVLGNSNARLSVADYREEAHKRMYEEQQRKANKIVSFVDRKESFVFSFEELIDRAKAIGYVNEYKEWEGLGYSLRSYVAEGHITDDEGYEVFSYLCNGNDERNYWDSLRARGIAAGGKSIGTFIAKSNEAGFKRNFRYYHAASRTQYYAGKIETVKFDKYISTEFAKSMLEQPQKALIKAPTGSGKTTSFIDAALELQCENEAPSRYYIVSVPTIAITEQTGNNKGVLAIKGETANIFRTLKTYSDSGNRVIVTTYDMAAITTDLIRKVNPFASFSYIIDEFHQLTHSYNYRREAIDSLFALRKNAKAFIGLSGTVDDILRKDFDKEVHVHTKYMKAPCRMWGAITYRKKADEEPQLIQLIKQKVEAGKRLLVFIQKKDVIQRVRDVLRKSGIDVATITSDSKSYNKAYKHIVEESEFPPGIQVILTTTVLSDGININNVRKNDSGQPIKNNKGEFVADLSFECIVLSSQQSPNFNVSMVRQMANRFRHEYGGFYLFMQQALKQTEFLYNIDQAHEYEILLAENAISLIKEEFEGRGNAALFRKSIIENRFGIDYDEYENFFYNELLIRYNVAKEKNAYYGIFRNQFIAALTLLMGEEPKESINISDYLEREEINYNDIIEEIQSVVDENNLSQQEMAARIEINYTPFVHKAFVEDNKEVLDEFRKVTTTRHFKALQELAPLMDYHTSLKLVKQINKNKEMYEFKKRAEALLDVFYYSKVDRTTPTKEAFRELARHAGVAMTKDELETVISSVSHQFRRSKKVDVKYIASNYFYHEATRTKSERFTTLHILGKEHLMKQYGLSEREIDVIMHEFINKESSTKQIVLSHIFRSGT